MKYNFIMHFKQSFIWIRLGALVFFGCLFLWTFIPHHQTKRVTRIEWTDILAINSLYMGGMGSPPGNQNHSLEKTADLISSLPQTIEFIIPDLIWYGDRSQIQLRIMGGREGQDQSDTMPNIGNLNTDGAQNRLLIEADLDLSGLNVSPAAQIKQTWSKRGNLAFNWDISAITEGEHDGLIWIYGYLQDDVRYQDKRIILSAQHFTITVKRLLGLSMPSLRWVGGCGVLVSLGWYLFARLQKHVEMV